MESILITGGIGDAFALDSHRRIAAPTIFWGTPRHAALIELFGDRAERHVVVWQPSFNFGCFVCLAHALNTYRHLGLTLPDGLEGADDWSITKTFPDIEAGRYPFIGCPLATPEPPTPTLFVHSQTIRPPLFDAWETLLERLERDDLTAVVCGPCPNHPRLDQFHGSITEAVAVLCRCVGYVGINSCFSVLAAQLFDANALTIYGGTDWPEVYYAPHREFSFLRP